jgi:hypothetical protein
MMAEIIETQTKLPVFFGADDLAKLVDEAWPPIRRETHHLSLVAVMWKAEKLRRRGVNDAGRVWIFNLAQHVDRIIFTHSPHRRDEVTEAVDRQEGRAFKRRNEEAAREMRAMVFDVVKARAQLFLLHAKHARQLVLQIAHLRSVADSIFNLTACELCHPRRCE